MAIPKPQAVAINASAMPPLGPPPERPFEEYRERGHQRRQDRPHNRAAAKEIIDDEVGQDRTHDGALIRAASGSALKFKLDRDFISARRKAPGIAHRAYR